MRGMIETLDFSGDSGGDSLCSGTIEQIKLEPKTITFVLERVVEMLGSSITINVPAELKGKRVRITLEQIT